ncbi:transcriptional regulator [Kribbella aluminosa]|uniref:Transcriptional regulator n=1 Tax=Kribbella aluminosa TaxID=416017 RepID=A0ABS4UK30_9ACTN|nr:FMN-binding negative transcriptional regulator [Kribbella aluminosa]MBP2351994.1 transcriptional regulator [Kribbella aluminosa]
MHVYPRFAAPSQRAVVELVRTQPFATVVSAVDGQPPVASHLPVILPPDIDPDAPLVGRTLLGHMGRKNPHWELFRTPSPVLVIFSTSHGYVSPQVYDFAPAAPTLDYAAVHLTGEVELLEGEQQALEVVEATIEALESRRPRRWDPSPSREYFERIVRGVAAFRIRVTGEQSMFKLSQDMSPATRSGVREDLAGGPRTHPDLVELMTRMEDGTA